MNGVGEWLTRGLRALRDDLWTIRLAPLPPFVLLRRLPHWHAMLVGIAVVLAGVAQITDEYRQGAGYALSCSVAQGAALVLALWRPVPAWWLSTTVTVVVALGARSQLISGQAEPGASWPWGVPGLIAHAMVLLLLSLRLPTRASVAALGITALVTYVLEGLVGAANYAPSGSAALIVFAVVVLLGSALRGRREARTQLVEQETITAEERARRTVLEERSRIARELHDVVAHHMSVISIQAQVAPHLVENPSEELKENLAGIRQNAVEALTELRRVLGVLRSENPEDPYGLGAAGTGAAPDTPQPTLDRLDALMENTRAAGLDVVARIEGEAPVYPPGVQLSAYRIVQEALSNALRHAPGSRVRVEVTHHERGLHLEVNNSRPREPAPPSPGAGHGLLGMRERAVMLGGHVSAYPTLHGGFAVSAFLPRDGAATPRGGSGAYDDPDDLDDSAGPGIPDGLELVFPDDRDDREYPGVRPPTEKGNR
ncbi:histidine kinase [Streptomyces sp. NPDC005486]|uniref:sensor histidine kinase n=1 Tax=Streptomyces sp. NPDC005486 TaxID=3155345 RepID=UPI0033AF6F27